MPRGDGGGRKDEGRWVGLRSSADTRARPLRPVTGRPAPWVDRRWRCSPAWTKSVIRVSLWTLLAMSCGPKPADEPEAPAALEYEGSDIRLYRLGRRVDALYTRYMGDAERHECGMLSERAYAEFEDTLSALDPEVDYACGPETRECTPATRIHIEGFEHSPFACDVPVNVASSSKASRTLRSSRMSRVLLIEG